MFYKWDVETDEITKCDVNEFCERYEREVDAKESGDPNPRRLELKEFKIFGFTIAWVSTVFLGVDHSWDDADMPLLFETMVFPGGSYLESYCERYETSEEARRGHKIAVRWTFWRLPKFLYLRLKDKLGKGDGDW